MDVGAKDGIGAITGGISMLVLLGRAAESIASLSTP